MIEAFAAHLPVRIRFGEGVTALIPELVVGRRALALVEQPVLAIPAVAAAVAGLEVFCKPPGEPTFATIEEAAQRVSEARPEVIVAIGGGSALDLAKAARLVAGQGEPFRRFVAGEVAVRSPQVDLITVPTTSGTGSEVSGGAVVTDSEGKRKLGAAHPLMRAQDALVDPLLTLGLPSEATAWTGADALAQAIGAVIVSNGNVLSVAIGLESCRHIAAGLAAAVADGGNRDARAEMSLGSLLAGLAMNLSDSGADHALGHSIGATLGLPHGLTVGLMLAETLEVNRPQCADRLERVADALDEPEDGSGDGSRAIRAVRRLLAEIGLPTLREVGVEESHLERLVELSLADYCLTVNPRVWTEADVRRAYADALALDLRQ
ncbi:MAG: choline dehydrogenase [Gaiellales bacterium]|nr:choline dehydrogenase [Gaiellales bacterium]